MSEAMAVAGFVVEPRRGLASVCPLTDTRDDTVFWVERDDERQPNDGGRGRSRRTTFSASAFHRRSPIGVGLRVLVTWATSPEKTASVET